MSRKEKPTDALKHKLLSYRSIVEEEQQLKDEIASLDARMKAPGTQEVTGMPRHSEDGDHMAGMLSEYMELRSRYIHSLHNLCTAQAEIEDIIEGLEPMERKLMRCRYIDGMTWEQVCIAIGYSWRGTHNIHSRILQEILRNKSA